MKTKGGKVDYDILKSQSSRKASSNPATPRGDEGEKNSLKSAFSWPSLAKFIPASPRKRGAGEGAALVPEPAISEKQKKARKIKKTR